MPSGALVASCGTWTKFEEFFLSLPVASLCSRAEHGCGVSLVLRNERAALLLLWCGLLIDPTLTDPTFKLPIILFIAKGCESAAKSLFDGT